MAAGEALLAAIAKRFFNFRVSVMLDSNGSNTTAAAGVAQIAKGGASCGYEGDRTCRYRTGRSPCRGAFQQGRSASNPDLAGQTACNSGVSIGRGALWSVSDPH